MGQSIATKRHIVSYLRRHVDSWFEYVTGSPDGLGYELEMQDIRFVSGTIKTGKWACASVSEGKGVLKVSLTAPGRLGISGSIGNDTMPNGCYNYGPVAQPLLDSATAARGSATRVPLAEHADQCIFFNYYGLKRNRRFLPYKLQAGSGPHELPPGDRDSAKSSPIRVATGSASEYPNKEQLLSDITVSLDLFAFIATLLTYTPCSAAASGLILLLFS